MQGRLAALVGARQVEIQEFEVPEPGPGAVVVRIRRANICGSEVHIFRFNHPVLRECVLGHEFVGEVVALGAGVETDYAGDRVAIGDRVTAAFYRTCRKCRACLRGDFMTCERGLENWAKRPEEEPHFHGAFATHYYIHPDQYFFKVPDEVSDSSAAGANCALSQVMFGLLHNGLQAGDRLVIQGAGGLGLYAAAVAHDAGARVIVVERIAARLELALRFGAEHVIDMAAYETVDSRVDRVRQLTDGDGADFVLEVTGVAAAFAEALELVRHNGTVVSIGNVNIGAEHEISVAPGLITRKALTVRGVVRYQPWYLHRALQFLRRRHDRYPFDELTDREYGLEDVADAIEREEAREVARPAIVPA